MSNIRKTILLISMLTACAFISCSGISLSGSEIGNPESQSGNPPSVYNGFTGDTKKDTLVDSIHYQDIFPLPQP
jgi:hypothetical protein